MRKQAVRDSSTRATSLVIALFALAALPGTVVADDACQPIAGVFESAVVPPPTCTVDPPLLCTRGVLEGDIDGTFDFTMSASTEIPPVAFFTGGSDIETDEVGTLTGTDMGAIDFSNGDFVTNIRITEGSGELTGATGRIVAIGVIDLAAGTTSGDYVGELCLAGDDDDSDSDSEDSD